MKASINKYKRFLRKNIWADFLFTFIVYFLVQLLWEDTEYSNLRMILINSALFSILLTPIFRLIRDDGNSPYEFVDSKIYFMPGHIEAIKAYLESKGYHVSDTINTFTYFNNGKPFEYKNTFVEETEYYSILVAKQEILDDAPNDIPRLYPSQASPS